VIYVSAKDIFHEAVKQALQKEQWVITDDPGVWASSSMMSV
jgi:hypothetical protein